MTFARSDRKAQLGQPSMDDSWEAMWKREHARAEAAVGLMHDYRRYAEHWKALAMKRANND